MTKRNFLLAKGERLTKDVIVRTGGQPKEAPYTFAEARARLKPMLTNVAHRLDRLPAAACPDDSAVASVTLNPEYIAKSYFPSDLLHSVGLTSVGSRPKRVTPQKRSRGREPEETVTTEMFLMGTRAAFRDWSEEIGQWRSSHSGARQLSTIEAVTAPAPSEKLIHVERADDDKAVFEVVLHTGEQRGEDFFVPKFKEYLESLGLSPPLQRRFYAGGLCFLELEAPRDLIEDVAAFSLVRAIRPMPALRMLRPPIRTAGVSKDIAILPTTKPVDPKLRSVIFDGGLPGGHPLTKWATPIVFRPNEEVFKDDNAEHASTKSFFGKSWPRLAEDELRRDSWKWENCQHAQNRYHGHSLNAPVFDIHYNARFEGRNDTRSQKLKYALVVSVTAKRVPDLYDRVVRRYRTQLEALRPVIEIPVRVDTDDTEGSP
jgi:hypothetical protein